MIRSLHILAIFAFLIGLRAGVELRARADEDTPEAQEDVFEETPSKPVQKRRVMPRQQTPTDPAEKPDTYDETSSKPAAVADTPIPGLDSDGAPEATSEAAVVPYRWLDQNYQYLNEGDPCPP